MLPAVCSDAAIVDLSSLRTVVRVSEDVPTIMKAFLPLCPLCALTLGLSICMGRDAFHRNFHTKCAGTCLTSKSLGNFVFDGKRSFWEWGGGGRVLLQGASHVSIIGVVIAVCSWASLAVARRTVPVLFEFVNWPLLNFLKALVCPGIEEMAMADCRWCAGLRRCRCTSDTVPWSLCRCFTWSSRPQPMGSGGDATPCKVTREERGLRFNLLPQVLLQSGF